MVTVKNISSDYYDGATPSGFDSWLDYWAKGGNPHGFKKKIFCAVHHKYEADLEGAHVKIFSLNGIFQSTRIYIVPVCKSINDGFDKAYQVDESILVEIPADHYKPL